MNKQTMRRNILPKKKRVLILAILTGIVLLFIGFFWFVSFKWSSISTSKVIINGKVSLSARVYMSPHKNHVLVVLNDADDNILYIINVPRREMGLADPNDFYFIANRVALPKTSLPTIDLMPSEAFSYPDPHLIIKEYEIDFHSFNGLETKIFFRPSR
jgi:hypothetical protein